MSVPLCAPAVTRAQQPCSHALVPSILARRALQAAQAKLQESKDAKKRAKQEADDEDGLYVYLPPGSSMRDPVSLPNSMSDPLDNRRVRQGWCVDGLIF